MEADENMTAPEMDADNLYREEVVTDRRVGSIRIMTPIRRDGGEDSSRPVLYVGQAQLMTPAGALPLNFEIPAQSLDEAVGKFKDETEKAVERTVKELEEMRRDAASSLVLPQGGEGMGSGGGMPGGGMPGGGIQMP